MSEFTTEQKKRLIEQLSDSSTALVCNALDLLGIETPYMDETIRCMTPGLPELVGEVVTIRVDSSSIGNTPDASLYYKMLEDMSKSDIPKVVVIQTVGSDKRRECVAGDGMAKTMLSVGARGACDRWRDSGHQRRCQPGIFYFCHGSCRTAHQACMERIV